MRYWLKLLLVGGMGLAMGAWTVPALAAAQGTWPGDAAATRTLEKRLAIAPGVPAYFIRISAKNGVVTLSGAVNDLLAREQAGLVAETIPGVRSVRNDIEVRPVAQGAVDIHRRIADALSAAPALGEAHIYAHVNGGFVILTGTVESWPERHLAALLAEGVPGVKGIDNKLRVRYGLPRSDASIAADIRSRIRWDPWLQNPELKVIALNGQVRLQGLVASATAREHVYQDGWVNGVKAVDVSAVEIVPNVRLAMNEAGLTRGAALRADGHPTDAELQTAIAEACHYDPLLRSNPVQVQVKDGVVALRGSVSTPQAKVAAQEIAREFVAAGQVENLLQIRAAQSS